MYDDDDIWESILTVIFWITLAFSCVWSINITLRDLFPL